MAVVRLCSFDDLAPSSARRVIVDGPSGASVAIAVVRIGDDLYAIGDVCSHADVSLSDGTLWPDDCELECPKHGSLFSLRSGAPSTLPATRPVPVYSVRREGDDVVVDLP